MRQVNRNRNQRPLPDFNYVCLCILLLGLSACGGGGGSGSSEKSSDEPEDESQIVTNAPVTSNFTLLAANDLGMHCADLDYQVFSILPPFNVIHAQVIKTGSSDKPPKILDNQSVNVAYAATSSSNDPAGANSINTNSDTSAGIFKGNFWADSAVALPLGAPNFGANYTVGGMAYAPLYPNAPLAGALLEPPQDLSSLCADPGNKVDCPSALSLFEPIESGRGLPVPDLVRFYPLVGNPVAELSQQAMPGHSNMPQGFARFDHDLPFFVNFAFGSRLTDVNWFAADGIPIMPVDDAGGSNSYPLMQVSATSKQTDATLAKLDIVLPVASEADCQNCHADPIDCQDSRLPQALLSNQCNGSGVQQTAFEVVDIDSAPGETIEQKLLNAAKINILRLHDVKHGSAYRNWNANNELAAMPCDSSASPPDSNCLAQQTPIQCARCHYTPALDLLQTGPVDEPEQSTRGRQQTSHISMSRAMHGHHGSLPAFEGKELFPAMPAPKGRSPQLAGEILGDTCYQCHPGKRTQCLRGAMFAGGVVCQDCHGDMQQVGNDFTMRVSSDNPADFILDGSLRVPWASEPGCQSCHTGDAAQLNHPANAIVADDGIRLLQAYRSRQISVPGVATNVKVAELIKSPTSRFAENQNSNASGKTVDVLYRLSTGHGGVMCEGCHNSTHAIWPNQYPNANDNIAANQLQGHTGTLTECTTCHAAGSLKSTLDGPHGMHPVGDKRWNEGHSELAEKKLNKCKSCHGKQLEGTVLSRMATTRTLKCDSDSRNCKNERITLNKGTEVSCTQCHKLPEFD
jgi:hypothetical protein